MRSVHLSRCCAPGGGRVSTVSTPAAITRLGSARLGSGAIVRGERERTTGILREICRKHVHQGNLDACFHHRLRRKQEKTSRRAGKTQADITIITTTTTIIIVSRCAV
ncbi:unnamed protein product [Pleuronectes platessa]|uniref:Uncharacterized protein n=1 Tax=Pleuronectes platessa TaxID=8262 RepID=A0A9N7VIH7_PLEPL|nr:unnamed protein product [Pleuronectes platessa]